MAEDLLKRENEEICGKEDFGSFVAHPSGTDINHDEEDVATRKAEADYFIKMKPRREAEKSYADLIKIGPPPVLIQFSSPNSE